MLERGVRKLSDHNIESDQITLEIILNSIIDAYEKDFITIIMDLITNGRKWREYALKRSLHIQN